MKIRELLTDKSKWTQGKIAQDRDGKTLWSALDPAAVQWCLIGAARRCYGEAELIRERDTIKVASKEALEVLAKIKAYLYPNRPPAMGDVVFWNDNPYRTFDEVKVLVDKLDI